MAILRIYAQYIGMAALGCGASSYFGDPASLIVLKTLMTTMYLLAGHGLSAHFARKDDSRPPLWEVLEAAVADGLLFGAFMVMFTFRTDSNYIDLLWQFAVASGAFGFVRFVVKSDLYKAKDHI